MPEKNEIIIYTTSDGKETFEVNLKKETVWLSQKQMAELFEKNTDTIGLHIKNIFSTKELDNKSTTEEYSVVQKLLFLWFLNENGILYNEDGSKRLADNALVALTLLIAESRAEEKDTMVKVVVNLINQNN